MVDPSMVPTVPAIPVVISPEPGLSWIQLISQLGFPIFVCLWFMWRDYKFLVTLQTELEKLNNLLRVVLKIRDEV